LQLRKNVLEKNSSQFSSIHLLQFTGFGFFSLSELVFAKLFNSQARSSSSSFIDGILTSNGTCSGHTWLGEKINIIKFDPKSSFLAFSFQFYLNDGFDFQVIFTIILHFLSFPTNQFRLTDSHYQTFAIINHYSWFWYLFFLNKVILLF
jgi:hypothetical protein